MKHVLQSLRLLRDSDGQKFPMCEQERINGTRAEEVLVSHSDLARH